MDNDKEKMNPFFKVLIALFIIFIAFYIALESGYYPSRVEKKTILTNKNIYEFENDLKDGNEIKKEGYIEKEEDYSNFVTKAGTNLTYLFGKVIEEGSKGVSKTIKVLFW